MAGGGGAERLTQKQEGVTETWGGDRLSPALFML